MDLEDKNITKSLLGNLAEIEKHIEGKTQINQKQGINLMKSLAKFEYLEYEKQEKNNQNSLRNMTRSADSSHFSSLSKRISSPYTEAWNKKIYKLKKIKK